MTTGNPRDALAAAGIPRERWGAERLRSLASGERAFCRWILRSLAEGASPGPDELAGVASSLELDVEQALERLAREDLVHYDPAACAILVAYPFSGRPTAHRVRFDGREVYAMCAIDALGVAPMLQRPIEVVSSDPVDRQTIRVTLSPEGMASWAPAESVVVSGRACEGAAFQGCCQVLNFFASPENARWYLDEHPHVRGFPSSIPEAVELGRVVFADVL